MVIFRWFFFSYREFLVLDVKRGIRSSGFLSCGGSCFLESVFLFLVEFNFRIVVLNKFGFFFFLLYF